MKVLLMLTVLACASGALADGPIPAIKLPDFLTSLIPKKFLTPLDSLNDAIKTLNGMLDLDKWTSLLSSAGEAGKAVITSLKSFIDLFVSGNYTSLLSLGNFFNDVYNAADKVQASIKKVNEIPLFVPGLSQLDGAIGSVKGIVGYTRCMNPMNCLFGKRSIEDEIMELTAE